MGKNTVLEKKHALGVQTIIIMFSVTIKYLEVITFFAKGIYTVLYKLPVVNNLNH